jgi:tetratricopeptide (TPR) repeat protein
MHMTTKLWLAAAFTLGVLASTAWGQNELRPGRLPDGPAKAIDAPAEDNSPAVKKKPSGSNAQEAKLLLHEAAQISSSGKTVEECTEVIELCKRASGMTLTPEESKYGRDLASWAHNKRGELYAAQAVEFLEQGSDKEAARLDRQALADFQAAVKLDANRWKAIQNRGVSYGVLGLHDDALADFTRVTQIKPDYFYSWFNRAEINLETGRNAEAVRDYTAALKLKSDDASTYRQRARAYDRLGKVGPAILDYTKAMELNDKDAPCVVERGELYAQQGNWELADRDYRSAIEIDPDCAEAYRGIALLMSTCPQAKYRNAKFAVEMGEQAIELAQAQHKNDFTYYDALAAAYANAGRFEEAQSLLQRAIPKAPLDAAAAMKKRLALYASGKSYRENPPAETAKAESTRVQK